MMKIFFYLMFMIMLSFLSLWWEFCYMLMLIMFFYMNFYHFNNYFSNLSYFLGSDLMSMSLNILVIWIIMLMLMASFQIYSNKILEKFFLFNLFIMLFFLLLSFSVYNFFFFFFFFESSLIPTLIMIFVWGYQPERLSAGLYLLFYTLFASLPLLLALFFLYNDNFSLFYFFSVKMLNLFLYFSLIMAFLVKIPMFFFHFWLPKAHVEAPISGSMILAGILLKLGGYGLMRIFNFLYKFGVNFNYLFISISLLGMVLVGFICLMQFDMKLLIAYSSVGHMGMVVCGIFTLNNLGMYGGLIMMLAHGLCSSGLFCLANMNYERLKSRSFYINKGLINFIPSMSLFWFLLSINNMASPPSLNLLGEILLINSLMSWSTLVFIFLFISSFMSCCYSIYLYSFNQHGIMYGGLKNFSMNTNRELFLLFFHWLPLNFLILKIDIFVLWI
uniref:NADH-ubiquinone oxidoreductase chain 4 n=1 Tax=Oncylocotis sp. PJ-2015 TaxID=1663423 RepID=A0A342D262_9HEMI|nr:NADH dehydrogenase subunit 4 [Oncylocotis sp. PJ-2015]